MSVLDDPLGGSIDIDTRAPANRVGERVTEGLTGDSLRRVLRGFNGLGILSR